MADGAINVLFVCEDNSARSVMAEALLKRFGSGRFRAFSAGIEPAPQLHPLTLDMLQVSGLDTPHPKPASVREFLAFEAPAMDFVIGMGSGAAATLESWPGNPVKAQWGITDPLTPSGSVVVQRNAFRRAFRELENRIRLFVLVRHQVSEEANPAERVSQSA